MKKCASDVFFFGIGLIGLALMLYPTVCSRLNTARQSKTVSCYIQTVENLDERVYNRLRSEAQEYNRICADRSGRYKEMLNIDGSGIMGYLEIPRLNILIPVCHGTDEDTLRNAAGHLDWSSLPVGGRSTHCVITAHRGLPNARLFTDLDKLVPGDVFRLYVLKEVLTYEVDQILTVQPHETDALQIREGEDLCTLATCTPYGINTHRLLVRGHRVEAADGS